MTDTTTYTATFKCKKCGGTVLELTDDSIAKCKSCGTEFGRLGDIKAKVRKSAVEHLKTDLKAALRGAVKGKKSWTIK